MPLSAREGGYLDIMGVRICYVLHQFHLSSWTCVSLTAPYNHDALALPVKRDGKDPSNLPGNKNGCHKWENHIRFSGFFQFLRLTEAKFLIPHNCLISQWSDIPCNHGQVVFHGIYSQPCGMPLAWLSCVWTCHVSCRVQISDMMLHG